MKKLIVITLILSLLTGCRKEDKYMDTGTITGTDPRDCMCCGGWFIEIKDTMRRFDQLPADCVIDFNTITYPLKVKLHWKKRDPLCIGDEIIVSKMIIDN